MHKASFTDNIKLINGELYRVVYAYNEKYTDKKIAIYKENENSEKKARYYAIGSIAGYLVEFPHTIETYPYSNIKYEVKVERFYPTRYDFNAWCRNRTSKQDIKNILKKYPNFKFLYEKNKNKILNNQFLFYVLQLWIKNPEIEILFDMNLHQIALNKSFYKLNEKKRKEILNFYKQNKNSKFHNLPLSEVQKIVKYKISKKEYEEFEQWQYSTSQKSYVNFAYLKKVKNHYPNMSDGELVRYYYDYLQLLKQTNHDKKDPYWLYPKKLIDFHDKVLQEVNEIKALKELQRKKETEEKERTKFTRYLDVVKPLFKYKEEVEGYNIFIPETIEQWLDQAEKLHQCFVRANYMERVCEKKCVLIFIQDIQNNPIATCEILPSGKIGQFYTDELDRSNCRPSEELKQIFNQWYKNKKMFPKTNEIKNAA